MTKRLLIPLAITAILLAAVIFYSESVVLPVSWQPEQSSATPRG